MRIWLDPHAPRTNAIMGAVCSGGDLIKLAKMMENSSDEDKESEDKGATHDKPNKPR